MKTFIKFLPLFTIWAVVALVSAYKILVVQKQLYNKYNNMTGTIEWVTFAPRSGVYICGARLDDGTYGEINWGSSAVSTGSRFRNHMQYGYFMGLVGLAYCVEPEDMPGIGWSLAYMYTFVGPIIGFILFWLVYKPISWWIKNH